MVGALNKLPVAASGILFFGEPATLGNVSGIFFGLIAGLLYSYSKTDQAQKNLALANGSSLSNKSDTMGLLATASGGDGPVSAGGAGGLEMTSQSVGSGGLGKKVTALPLYQNTKIAD
jgi:GDP-mannose transporter